jgi:hypothetical protein
MITTTLGAIAMAEPALDRLGARPLPARVAYSAAKLLKLVRNELKMYQQLHNDLVKKHGVETPPGSGQFQVPPDKFATFRDELQDVLDSKVEILWTPLALDALGNDPIRADDLAALDAFIVENASTETPTKG